MLGQLTCVLEIQNATMQENQRTHSLDLLAQDTQTSAAEKRAELHSFLPRLLVCRKRKKCNARVCDWNILRFTSSFWHWTSTSSLERQKTQFFLFLPLFFWSSVAIRFKTLASVRLHWRDCSSLTFPCFHSSWRGQQLFALFDTIYKRIYNLSTIMSEQIGFETMNPQETRVVTRRRLCYEIRDPISLSSYLFPLTYESPEKGQNNRSEQEVPIFGGFGLEIVFFRKKYDEKNILNFCFSGGEKKAQISGLSGLW